MKEEAVIKSNKVLVGELSRVGAHYGYSRSRRHPSAKPFIFGFKNRSAIIDLEKSVDTWRQAAAFIESLGRNNKLLLLVGTKAEARAAVREAGERLGLPYVVERWIGGTLTNFSEIKKRIERLAELLEKRASGSLDAETKKERLLFDREIAKLEKYFQTIKGLTRLPDALFVVDSDAEAIAVREAKKLGLPVISLSGTDCDLSLVDYPVVVNDGVIAGIKLLVNDLAESYERGRALGVSERAALEAAATPPVVASV